MFIDFYLKFSFYAKMSFYTSGPFQTILKTLFQISLLISSFIYNILYQMTHSDKYLKWKK